MSDYLTTLREHARLAILRFLADAPRYTSNVSMLAAQLPALGIGMTRDQVQGEVEWLREAGLAEVEKTGIGLVIVTATLRGVEVAEGIARHHGVQRRGPGH